MGKVGSKLRKDAGDVVLTKDVVFQSIQSRRSSGAISEERSISMRRACAQWEFGELIFDRNESAAKFLKISSDIVTSPEFPRDIINPDTSKGRNHFMGDWNLKRPEILLWVTGQSTGHVVLEPRLDHALRRGLKRMARSTDAWVLTGGMNVGVMAYVGQALARVGDTPCIGIASVQKVRGWDGRWPGVPDEGKLEVRSQGGRGGPHDTSHASDADLEEHHTHFLFVDNPKNNDWHGELSAASVLRHVLSSDQHVPVVTLIIGGTIGNLEDALDALNSEQRSSVVVVRESGGCAQALAEFLGDYCQALMSEEGAMAAHQKEREVASQLEMFVKEERLENLLMTGLRFTSEKEKHDRRNHAKRILSAIAVHRRVASRLRIYSLRNDESELSARADIEMHLLHGVVESIKLDVMMNAQFGTVSTDRHLLRDPEPFMTRLCMKDNFESTKYPPRLRVEEGTATQDDWRRDLEEPPREEDREPREEHRGEREGRGGTGPEEREQGEMRSRHWKRTDAELRYQPRQHTSQNVIKNSKPNGRQWADHVQPDHPDNRWVRRGLADKLGFKTTRDWPDEKHERPLNPSGRTGLRGRGSLALWGPNPSIDPIITRKVSGATGDDVYQMLVERRPDFQCGIPGVQFQYESAFTEADVNKVVVIRGRKATMLDPQRLEEEQESLSQRIETYKDRTAELSQRRQQITTVLEATDAKQMIRLCPPWLLRTFSVLWEKTAVNEGEETPSYAGKVVEVNVGALTMTLQDSESEQQTLELPMWGEDKPRDQLGAKLGQLKNWTLKQVDGTKKRGSVFFDKDHIEKLWHRLEETAREVYHGDANDPRDTDNAWARTTAVHFEICERLGTAELGEVLDSLPKEVEDQRTGRQVCFLWIEMNRLTEPRYNALYALHRRSADMVHAFLVSHTQSGKTYSKLVSEKLSDQQVHFDMVTLGDSRRKISHVDLGRCPSDEDAFDAADVGKLVHIERDDVVLVTPDYCTQVLNERLQEIEEERLLQEEEKDDVSCLESRTNTRRGRRRFFTTSFATADYGSEMRSSTTEQPTTGQPPLRSSLPRLVHEQASHSSVTSVDDGEQPSLTQPMFASRMSMPRDLSTSSMLERLSLDEEERLINDSLLSGDPTEMLQLLVHKNYSDLKRFKVYWGVGKAVNETCIGEIARVDKKKQQVELMCGRTLPNPKYCPLYVRYDEASKGRRSEEIVPQRDRAVPHPAPTWSSESSLFISSRIGPDKHVIKEFGIANDHEKRQKRGSYEFVKFVEGNKPPLNPRGRTGFCGMGELRYWGPNHCVDMIVTRRDPYSSDPPEYQVLAHVEQGGDGKLKYKLPGKRFTDFKMPTATMMQRVFQETCLAYLDAYYQEVHQRKRREGGSSPDAIIQQQRAQRMQEARSARLKQLQIELFQHEQELYRGYVDDPRNTDNAWIETICQAFHCGGELGAMLEFPRDGNTMQSNQMAQMVGQKRLQQVQWVPFQHLKEKIWYASHDRLVKSAVAILERQLKEHGLLEIVVGFGRSQIVEKVLRTPKLSDERASFKMQRVFEEALRMAAADANFDLDIIQSLLTHGAKISNVWLSMLFDKSSTPMRSVAEIIEQRRLVRHLEQSVTDTAPWAEAYHTMIDQIIPGFSAYAQSRNAKLEGVSPFDLMVWAICNGATKLALFMWRRTQSPLRAALIGQQLCERFRVMEINLDYVIRDALKAGEDEFNDANRALLNMVALEDKRRQGALQRHDFDDSEAMQGGEENFVRQLLYPDIQMVDDLGHIHGDQPMFHSTRAQIKACTNALKRAWGRLWHNVVPDQHTSSRMRAALRDGIPHEQRRLLDLAVQFKNEQFTSHPCCTALIDEIWRGNHPYCGRLMLTRNPSIWEKLGLSLCAFTVIRPRLNPMPIKCNRSYKKELPESVRDAIIAKRSSTADTIGDGIVQGRQNGTTASNLFKSLKTPLAGVESSLSNPRPSGSYEANSSRREAGSHRWSRIDLYKQYGSSQTNFNKLSRRGEGENDYLSLHRWSWYETFKQATDVWRIPSMKQWHASAMLICFSALFVITSFQPLCNERTSAQWALYGFVGTYIVQEVHQALRSPYHVFNDANNFLDWGLCAMLAVSVFYLRQETMDNPAYQQGMPTASKMSNLVEWWDLTNSNGLNIKPFRPVPWAFSSDKGTVLNQYHSGTDPLGHCEWSVNMELLRTLHAFSLLLILMRIFEIFTFRLSLARIVFTVYEIYGNDFVRMFWLLVLIMTGFGFSFGILSPNFQLDGTDGPIYALREFDAYIDVGAGSSLWQAMFAVFGYFDVADLSSAPQAAFVTPLVLYVYLFFVTMPIINLLIAMFSESYGNMTEDRAKAQWHLRNAEKCIIFLKMYYALPMPLNVVGLAFSGLTKLWKMCIYLVRSLIRRRRKGDLLRKLDYRTVSPAVENWRGRRMFPSVYENNDGLETEALPQDPYGRLRDTLIDDLRLKQFRSFWDTASQGSEMGLVWEPVPKGGEKFLHRFKQKGHRTLEALLAKKAKTTADENLTLTAREWQGIQVHSLCYEHYVSFKVDEDTQLNYKPVDSRDRNHAIGELDAVQQVLLQAARMEQAARDKYIEQEREEIELQNEHHRSVQAKLNWLQTQMAAANEGQRAQAEKVHKDRQEVNERLDQMNRSLNRLLMHVGAADIDGSMPGQQSMDESYASDGSTTAQSTSGESQSPRGGGAYQRIMRRLTLFPLSYSTFGSEQQAT